MLGETSFSPYFSLLKKEMQVCGRKESRQFWEQDCGLSPCRLDTISAGEGQSHGLQMPSPRIKTFIYAKFMAGGSQCRKSAQCVLLRLLTSVMYMLALIQ